MGFSGERVLFICPLGFIGLTSNGTTGLLTPGLTFNGPARALVIVPFKEVFSMCPAAGGSPARPGGPGPQAEPVRLGRAVRLAPFLRLLSRRLTQDCWLPQAEQLP